MTGTGLSLGSQELGLYGPGSLAGRPAHPLVSFNGKGCSPSWLWKLLWLKVEGILGGPDTCLVEVVQDCSLCSSCQSWDLGSSYSPQHGSPGWEYGQWVGWESHASPGETAQNAFQDWDGTAGRVERVSHLKIHVCSVANMPFVFELPIQGKLKVGLESVSPIKNAPRKNSGYWPHLSFHQDWFCQTNDTV